ncbi:MAG: hypothetical protein Q4G25_00835 [Paracoccus sp. (in: a-proteobacteria)]|nr:hypothetical protein [Paracoccus sp. (in: a-proteobacteria)]
MTRTIYGPALAPAPIPLKKRLKMTDQGDRSVCAYEPPPQPPALNIDDAIALTDGLIRDGWISPESRLLEIAVMYHRQLFATGRDERRRREREDKALYAAGWVRRILNYPMGRVMNTPAPVFPSLSELRAARYSIAAADWKNSSTN